MARTIREAIRDFRRRIRNGENDALTVQRALLTCDAPTIVDAGANVGRTAARYRAQFPTATIHCIEPFPGTHEILVRRHGSDPRVHCHQVALGATECTATLTSNASQATNSLLATAPHAAAYWGRKPLETRSHLSVQVTTLDHFALQHSIAHIDILKMDLQGGEYDALAGARGLLADQRISIVFTEIILSPTYAGQRSLHDYMALLGGSGYEFLDFYSPVRRHGELMQVDALFLASRFNAERRRRIESAS